MSLLHIEDMVSVSGFVPLIFNANYSHVYCYFSIASGLLEYILKKATEDKEIKEVYLHVQVNNEAAKSFYLRHGFDEIEVIKDYYRKIDPADCYLFRRLINREGESDNTVAATSTTSLSNVDTDADK